MCWLSFFFFFNDTATTEIYTLSLHDALPILVYMMYDTMPVDEPGWRVDPLAGTLTDVRSEEHTSELQSLTNLVCRLLLEKKKAKQESHVLNNNTLFYMNRHDDVGNEISIDYS